MVDLMNPGGQGGNSVGQGTANLILQALNGILQALKGIAAAMPAATSGTGTVPGSIVTSAGQASGKYIIVTANGQNFAVPLYKLQ